MRRLIATLLALIPCHAMAQDGNATSRGAFADWSYFCEDICWVATRTREVEYLVMVSLRGQNGLELSVMRQNGRPITEPRLQLQIDCFTDEMFVHQGAAFPSTTTADQFAIGHLAASTGGTLTVSGRTLEFRTRGFAEALSAAGYPKARGLPAAAPCPAS